MNIYQMIIPLVLIMVIACFRLSFVKKGNLKIQQQGVLNVQIIKALIYLVQQHRGMVSAYLNGDKEALLKISAIRQNIRAHIDKGGLSLANDNERWQSFIDHWQRLGVGSISVTVENSFAQHTALITNLLHLVEDEAERGLLFSQFLPQFPQAGYIWREVLGVTEIVGQARAIGVGVTTQKFCSSTDKIRLNFLQQQVHEVMSTVLDELYCLPKYINEHKRLIQIAQHQSDRLIQTLEQELLKTKEITLEQHSYFAQASSVIQAIDDVFEHQLSQISSTLSVTKPQGI